MNAERDAATRQRALRRALAGVLLLVACGDDPVDPDPGCGEAEPLGFDVTLLAELRLTDPRFDGSAIDYYSLRPGESGTLVVEMTAADPDPGADAVDPFLYLWTQDLGDPVAQAFDPDPSSSLPTARLLAEVGPGCYRLGASAWPGADMGPYTVRAHVMAPDFRGSGHGDHPAVQAPILDRLGHIARADRLPSGQIGERPGDP